MKTNKRILFSILGIIFLLSILIGTGVIKFELYKNEISNNISSTWNNSKSISRYNDSKEEISFPTIPIILIYKSKTVGDITAQNPFKIDISNKDFGSLWIPFIKKSGYNFSVTFNDAYEVKTNSVFGQFKINGEINVSGYYKFIGLCSKETATNLIVDKVLNDIYNEIKKNLQ